VAPAGQRDGPIDEPREPAVVGSTPGVAAAAANNAAWCDSVARTHGIAGVFSADAWTAPNRTPARYPDAVTLRPDVDPVGLLTRIDHGPGASVKDSFATLDLGPFGFRVLFDATWIARAPGGELTGDTATFAALHRDRFADWERAWRGGDGPSGVLRPALLDVPAVTMVAAVDADDRIVSGAALFVDAGVVGISNVFAPEDRVDDAWRGVVAWCALRHPGATLVGYESGADLAVAWRNGFEPLAPLRVWWRDEPAPGRGT
jgi:hypothetical protein